ncbi:MAG: nuclear transport factor 2 family protein [Mycobacterium sp.]
MAFIGSVEDRLKIRERLDSYSDAVFRGDVDDYLACWSEDGTRTGSGGECQGKPALREHWHGIFRFLARMTFFTQVAAIEVDGDRATARSYCREILVLRDGDVRKLIGVYDDTLIRADGDWLFARRSYQVILDEGDR